VRTDVVRTEDLHALPKRTTAVSRRFGNTPKNALALVSEPENQLITNAEWRFSTQIC
jgi:hypothetical protein